MTEVHTEVGPVRVPAGTWLVDRDHSSVGIEVKHLLMATVRGHFREFEGLLEAADDPARAWTWGRVDVASIDTGNPERDAHLCSSDFFDAERYPEMRFESSAVKHLGGGRYDVKGGLTIRDQTRQIDVGAIVEGAAEDPWGNKRVGISIRGAVNTNDFGLTWRQTLASGGLLVGEEVKIMIDITAVGP